MLPALGLPIADSAERAGARSELLAASGDDRYGARASFALAIAALQSGDTADVERWAQRLAGPSAAKSGGRKLGVLLAAMRLAVAGNPDSALGLTDGLTAVMDSGASAGGPFPRATLHLSRGRWLAGLGRLAAADSAWLWYEASDDLESAGGEPSVGEIDGTLSVLARLLRSEALLHLGEETASCGHVRRVRELWAGADPAFAPLRRRADSVEAACAE
jgi:hypothetical protein